MLGEIILLDIPKENAQIDMFQYKIQGGFRGFALVPFGLHYVRIISSDVDSGFWCYINPLTVIVKRFDIEKNIFIEAEQNEIANYSELARKGQMLNSQIKYPHESYGLWNRLVDKIKYEDIPVKIYENEEGEGSRIEKAFCKTHNKNVDSFLAEIQYSFITCVIHNNFNEKNLGYNRWRSLIQAIYNSGERMIKENPELYDKITDCLISQYSVLPKEWFTSESFLVKYSDYLIEDMKDTEIPVLVEKSQSFEKKLKNFII